jgi:hypothetical protein
MFLNDGEVMEDGKAVDGNQSEKKKLIDIISIGKMVMDTLSRKK